MVDASLTPAVHPITQTLEPVIITVDPAVPSLDSVTVAENSDIPTVNSIAAAVDHIYNREPTREPNVFLILFLRSLS